MMMALKSVAYAILILVSVHALPPERRAIFHRDGQVCFKLLQGKGSLGSWLNENAENYLVFQDCMLRINERHEHMLQQMRAQQSEWSE